MEVGRWQMGRCPRISLMAQTQQRARNPFVMAFVGLGLAVQPPATTSIFRESLARLVKKIPARVLFQPISRLFQSGLRRVFASLRQDLFQASPVRHGMRATFP